ncbi:unnamed protein product [Paramecium sonneborni]|uniref:ubiquitinyl hydrolase 1 n=1 Tax=Paramecium sonneborni TaxID=65129 RepID=A0A8S1MV57_9CILI|nr:unnamed protein product [Paramecium sonneborni]
MQQHQTQVLRRCGLHAVNNLLQQDKYTRADFENLANEIKQQTKQSHCTYYLGNYDINVIEKALLKENLELMWINQTQTIDIELLRDQQVYGLLINVIKEKSLIERICSWDPRHWISIRKIVNANNQLEFYYHDSQESVYRHEKDEKKMIQMLIDFQKNKDNCLLLVKRKIN